MTTSKGTKKRVTFRLSEDLLNRLKEEAGKAGMSLNSFVESLLMKMISKTGISKK